MEFVYFTATEVLERLSSMGFREISMALDMKRDLKKLERTMSTVNAVLLDAEEKQSHNQAISAWLSELKEVFSDAEQVLDEIENEALRKKVVKLYSNGTAQNLGRFFSQSCNPFVIRIRLGRKIREVRERFDEVASDRIKFHLVEGREERAIIKTSHSYVCASDVIGRDFDKENIIHLLMKPCESLSVVVICGIGGLGKTTLAKLVCNDDTVTSHFTLRMWVCVSEDFDLLRLVREILRSATGRAGEDSGLSLDLLQSRLREALKDRRFLLVLDDVWNNIPEKWWAIKEILSDGFKGSKVLVTTRKRSVADLVCTVPTYNLKGLSPVDCSSLLAKWAFKDGAEKQHQNLVAIGEQIVEKCNGVPLVVTTLGSLLRSKVDEREWKEIRDSEIWKLDQTEDHILPALRLSYNELPSHLKRCFQCCSLYPKGEEIKSSELIELWMAHGLIRSRSDENRSLEDVGESFIKELWSRSLFQDVRNDEVFYVLHLHDLIHDLAVSVSQNEFGAVNSPEKMIPERIKHVCITHECDKLPVNLHRKSVKTIIFQGHGYLKASLPNQMWKFESLKMLKLRFSSFRELPSSIGLTKNLRFLDLSYSDELYILPESICDLQSLQTLKLHGCGNLEGLPRDMKKLISLRFLSLTTKATSLPENGIGLISSLQTLLLMDCESLLSLPENMKCLTSLETLVISGCTKLSLTKNDDGQATNKLSLRKLQLSHLHYAAALPQWLRGCEDTLQFLSLAHCSKLSLLPDWLPSVRLLRKLKIVMCPRLQSFPAGMSRLKSLQEIKIFGCPDLKNLLGTMGENEWLNSIHFKDDFIT